jgi:sulfite reductase alpha subunit-like flavoprotein
MEEFNWNEEQKKIEVDALTEHERLNRLFKENRFAFELEKRRLINQIIESAGKESEKEKLRAIQDAWDSRMKNAGSKQNRLTLARHLFFEHVEKIWNPAINECSKELGILIRAKK